MNKKQIEIIFNLYEKIKNDSEKINKTLDILNSSNYNFFDYGFNIFDEFFKIIDEKLYSELEYLIYETNLGKNKLSSNEYYSITINNKEFILKNKEDCIKYLLENNFITDEEL